MTQQISLISWLVDQFVILIAPFVPPRGARTFINAWFWPVWCLFLAGLSSLTWGYAFGLKAAIPVALFSFVIIMLMRRRELMRSGRSNEWGIDLHSHHEIGLAGRKVGWALLCAGVGAAFGHWIG